jgi:hypothetical protein
LASAWQRYLALDAPLETDAGVHDTTIGEDGGRREVARAISRDEADHAGNLLRPRHSTHRYRLVQLGELCWILIVPTLIGVATAPGPTPTTRMLCQASSIPEVRVSMRMPPFDRQ